MSPRDHAPRPAGDVSRRREESTPALARDFSSSEGGRAPGRARRSWRIEMLAGQELLNANDRGHWSRRARITRQLRSDAFYLARYAKVPPLRRAKVVCVYEPPPVRGVHDVGNLAPSAKALVDGALVDAGVLPNDSDRYLEGPDMRRGDVHPQGRLVLLIFELDPNPQGDPHA